MRKIEELTVKELFRARDALVVLTQLGIEILGIEKIQEEIKKELDKEEKGE